MPHRSDFGAAISVRQVEQVLGLIHRLKEQGVAVMLISHRMPDVFAVCDRVIVMRRGEKRADKPIRETSPEEVTAVPTVKSHPAILMVQSTQNRAADDIPGPLNAARDRGILVQ